MSASLSWQPRVGMVCAWKVVHDGGCMLGRCSEVHRGNVVGFDLWGVVEAQRMVGHGHKA